MGKYFVEFEDIARNDLKCHYKYGNKSTLKKIEKILLELTENPFSGEGQPEALKYDFKIIELEVLNDHVHLLLDVNPRFGICKCIKLLKGATSKYIREEFSTVKSKAPCLWSGSYFVSSVGSVSLEIVKKYIEQQKNA